MTTHQRIAAALLGVLLGAAAQAHDGHDDAPATPQGAALAPSFEAHSDLFELVGSAQHGSVTIFLDRYADNAPVTNASIEIESGKVSGVATPNADGSYSFKSALFDRPGQVPLTITITAGQESDLLAANLLLPPAAAPAHGTAAWGALTPLAGAASVLLAVLAALAARLALHKRRTRHQGSAS